MTNRPCVSCGDIIASGSYCDDCDPHHSGPHTGGRTTYGTRWKNFSKRLRRLSPFCEECGATERLSVDHIIPVSERPEWEYERVNCRVLCKPCNSRKGTKIIIPIAVMEQRVREDKARRARRLRQANAPTRVTPGAAVAHAAGEAPLSYSLKTVFNKGVDHGQGRPEIAAHR